MGLRGGFLLGFLIGAVAASIASRPQTAEAPGSGVEPRSSGSETSLAERIRRHAKEAMAAAREAAKEKERELEKQFNEMRRRTP